MKKSKYRPMNLDSAWHPTRFCRQSYVSDTFRGADRYGQFGVLRPSLGVMLCAVVVWRKNDQG